MTDLATLAARFGARLRVEGMPVGPERSARFCAAIALTDPSTVDELYWYGMATLVADPAEIPTYDRVFDIVFRAFPDPAGPRRDPNAPSRPRETATLQRSGETPSPAEQPPPDEPDHDEEPVAALAAAGERLGGRDFASLSPDELALLITLMQQLRVATPLRRSRRYEPGSRGRRIDLRTTLRLALRSGGYPIRLARHRHRVRPRRLVVLCDISGSMEPYARALLQLLYCAASTSGGKAEVFTFATRLTRLTRVLAKVRPSAALSMAGKAAPDWSGGTRIGEALKVFLDRYGSRGLARGAVVLIISDGWETGDAALLGTQMARLSRLAYRIVWANPRTASPRYQPLVAGMAAALPYCDAVVSAHSLSAVDKLLSALAAP
jgi:uncharacterized protein with von Willebrand factor type A (vWA) domain